MQAIVVDAGTPMLADVQMLYERGREAHDVHLSLARFLRCQLGIVGGPDTRPETLASLQANRSAQLAQAQAKQLAEEHSRSNKQNFWNAVGTITNVLNAVSSTMNSAQQRAPAGSRDDCSWVPRAGGGGYCELGKGN